MSKDYYDWNIISSSSGGAYTYNGNNYWSASQGTTYFTYSGYNAYIKLQEELLKYQKIRNLKLNENIEIL